MTKHHIIDEIRRTAAENGGTPLGVKRFFTETGIRQDDWLGRYWIRWGDAVQEAGFAPNAFNMALTDDELLEKLASLVQDLGHFPVSAELKMQARADPTFPSHNTFRRYGGKPSIADRLLRFAIERGYGDVAASCELVAAQSVGAKPLLPRADMPTAGSVYMIRSNRFYKIGRSNSVGRREYELAIQLPEKVRLVHSISTDDPAGIEEYWHKRFSDRRKNGEWFELTADDVAAFRRRRFM